jgi:hypothetical protein
VTQVLQGGLYAFRKYFKYYAILYGKLAFLCILWMVSLLPLYRSSTRYRPSPNLKCECQNGTSISILMIEESPLHSMALPTFAYVLLFINFGSTVPTVKDWMTNG